MDNIIIIGFQIIFDKKGNNMDPALSSSLNSKIFIQPTQDTENPQEHVVEKKIDERQIESSEMATTQGSLLEKQRDAEFKQQFVSQQLQQITTVALDLKETNDAATFYKSIVDAKNAGLEEDRQNETFGTKDSKWFGAAVHTYPEEDYAQMRMFLSPDNKFGVAVKESGDIVSVFKHPATDKSIKAVDILLPKAIENGGTHLDCFNPILPILYAKHCMEPVAKVKFNEEFAPENWNFARDGTPDIIFMVYNKEAKPPQDPTLLKELVKKQISELPYSSYEEAIEKQTSFTKK